MGLKSDWLSVAVLMLDAVLLLPPGPSEAESFQLEMSGLMSELACPYAVLTSGDLSHRFLNRTDCLLLLSTTPATSTSPTPEFRPEVDHCQWSTVLLCYNS